MKAREMTNSSSPINHKIYCPSNYLLPPAGKLFQYGQIFDRLVQKRSALFAQINYIEALSSLSATVYHSYQACSVAMHVCPSLSR